MFAIIQNTAMESSHLGRPSPDISPTALPHSAESPPPPLIPYFKVEKRDERDSPAKLFEENREQILPDGVNQTPGAPIKFEPKDDQTDSQMLKQRLEMYWEGMVKYQQELQQETKPNLERGILSEIESESKVSLVHRKGISSQQPALSNVKKTQPMENNSLMRQESLFSQQALATAIAMQNLQQRRQTHDANLGSLLPPPPELISTGALTPSTSNSFLPRSSTVHSQIPHSISGMLTNSIPNPSTSFVTPLSETKLSTNLSHDSDVPLDLSLPTAGKKRLYDGTSKGSSNYSEAKDKSCKDRKKVDEVSLASIKSNFPTLLNSSRAQARATQQAMLTAHIESSLSNHPVSAATGPFTSLYQNHENGVTSVNSSSTELAQEELQPLQIQQWLLAAVSAQKMQQMALNHITMLQQQQQQQAVKNSEPQRKRPKVNEALVQSYVSHPTLPQSSISQQQPIFPQPLNRRLPGNHTLLPGGPANFSSTNRSAPKVVSPAHSPESNQSQSGKRYRRYAKPPYSYVSLITLSILSSRDKKLRLSQILKRISEMFPFFNGSYQGWRDSVRHNLSQNECFVKVLKNPYRPTAKGNFWTVNLNSIPHELLLRQNTLVSRYAQDSGYRYRKDLSEVFDLRTGALKISVPRHLLKDADDPAGSALSDDPAAVMEAILLEETSDDELSDFKDKISPEVRQFTLEDLFSQSEDGDEDSLLSSGRGRGRNKQSTQTLPHPPTLLPASFAPPIYQPSNPILTVDGSQSNTTGDVPNFAAMGVLPQVFLSQVSNHAAQIPMALPSTSPNPFAAAQTALLSKALAVTRLQGFDSLQKMLHANPGLRKSPFSAPNSLPAASPEKPISPPMPSSVTPMPKTTSPIVRPHYVDSNDQSVLSDASSSKKNKRKGIHPVRHTGNLESPPQGGHEEESMSPRNNNSAPAPGLEPASTPSRTASSEGDTNPFCSPITSSTKSQSRASPRHDESSEFEESRDPAQSIYGAQPAANMSFQALPIFGTPSIQASKMA